MCARIVNTQKLEMNMVLKPRTESSFAFPSLTNIPCATDEEKKGEQYFVSFRDDSDLYRKIYMPSWTGFQSPRGSTHSSNVQTISVNPDVHEEVITHKVSLHSALNECAVVYSLKVSRFTEVETEGPVDPPDVESLAPMISKSPKYLDPGNLGENENVMNLEENQPDIREPISKMICQNSDQRQNAVYALRSSLPLCVYNSQNLALTDGHCPPDGDLCGYWEHCRPYASLDRSGVQTSSEQKGRTKFFGLVDSSDVNLLAGDETSLNEMKLSPVVVVDKIDQSNLRPKLTSFRHIYNTPIISYHSVSLVQAATESNTMEPACSCLNSNELRRKRVNMPVVGKLLAEATLFYFIEIMSAIWQQSMETMVKAIQPCTYDGPSISQMYSKLLTSFRVVENEFDINSVPDSYKFDQLDIQENEIPLDQIASFTTHSSVFQTDRFATAHSVRCEVSLLVPYHYRFLVEDRISSAIQHVALLDAGKEVCFEISSGESAKKTVAMNCSTNSPSSGFFTSRFEVSKFSPTSLCIYTRSEGDSCSQIAEDMEDNSLASWQDSGDSSRFNHVVSYVLEYSSDTNLSIDCDSSDLGSSTSTGSWDNGLYNNQSAMRRSKSSVSNTVKKPDSYGFVTGKWIVCKVMMCYHNLTGGLTLYSFRVRMSNPTSHMTFLHTATRSKINMFDEFVNLEDVLPASLAYGQMALDGSGPFVSQVTFWDAVNIKIGVSIERLDKITNLNFGAGLHLFTTSLHETAEEIQFFLLNPLIHVLQGSKYYDSALSAKDPPQLPFTFEICCGTYHLEESIANFVELSTCSLQPTRIFQSQLSTSLPNFIFAELWNLPNTTPEVLHLHLVGWSVLLNFDTSLDTAHQIFSATEWESKYEHLLASKTKNTTSALSVFDHPFVVCPWNVTPYFINNEEDLSCFISPLSILVCTVSDGTAQQHSAVVFSTSQRTASRLCSSAFSNGAAESYPLALTGLSKTLSISSSEYNSFSHVENCPVEKSGLLNHGPTHIPHAPVHPQAHTMKEWNLEIFKANLLAVKASLLVNLPYPAFASVVKPDQTIHRTESDVEKFASECVVQVPITSYYQTLNAYEHKKLCGLSQSPHDDFVQTVQPLLKVHAFSELIEDENVYCGHSYRCQQCWCNVMKCTDQGGYPHFDCASVNIPYALHLSQGVLSDRIVNTESFVLQSISVSGIILVPAAFPSYTTKKRQIPQFVSEYLRMEDDGLCCEISSTSSPSIEVKLHIPGWHAVPEEYCLPLLMDFSMEETATMNSLKVRKILSCLGMSVVHEPKSTVESIKTPCNSAWPVYTLRNDKDGSIRSVLEDTHLKCQSKILSFFMPDSDKNEISSKGLRPPVGRALYTESPPGTTSPEEKYASDGHRRRWTNEPVRSNKDASADDTINPIGSGLRVDKQSNDFFNFLPRFTNGDYLTPENDEDEEVVVSQKQSTIALIKRQSYVSRVCQRIVNSYKQIRRGVSVPKDSIRPPTLARSSDAVIRSIPSQPYSHIPILEKRARLTEMVRNNPSNLRSSSMQFGEDRIPASRANLPSPKESSICTSEKLIKASKPRTKSQTLLGSVNAFGEGFQNRRQISSSVKKVVGPTEKEGFGRKHLGSSERQPTRTPVVSTGSKPAHQSTNSVKNPKQPIAFGSSARVTSNLPNLTSRKMFRNLHSGIANSLWSSQLYQNTSQLKDVSKDPMLLMNGKPVNSKLSIRKKCT
ncbi:unnamed protein product [Calicophoron daubneyi]|uniref:Uncharacterized protein n=1 Tax=Calicophoron daubneyi TaxID=300641 RepID=A0AAV2TCK7_CALDB